MKQCAFIILALLFISSCENAPVKNEAALQKLDHGKKLIGSWIAQPSYQADTIILTRVDSLHGRMENIIRFQSDQHLIMFDIDGDKNLYSCGNTWKYFDYSTWNLNEEDGLLYLDIFAGAVDQNTHTKKSYRIETVKEDSVRLVIFKTLVDEKK